MINTGALSSLVSSSNKGQFITQNLGNAISSVIYRMYLESASFGKLSLMQLPINPETFKTTASGSNDVYNIVGIGDVVRPRTPKLKEWSWDGLFMSDPTDPLNIPGLIYPPSIYISCIEKAMNDKTPIKFIQNSVGLVSKWLTGANCNVVIEDFKYEERGGEVGDIYYSITLKEYRNFGLQSLLLLDGFDNTVLTKSTRSTGKELTDKVKVTGNGDFMQTIQMDNGKLAGGNYTSITNFEGEVIGVPMEIDGTPCVKVKDTKGNIFYTATKNVKVSGGA